MSPSLSPLSRLSPQWQKGGRAAGRGQRAEEEARFDKQAVAEGRGGPGRRGEGGSGEGAAVLYIRGTKAGYVYLFIYFTAPDRFARVRPQLVGRRHCSSDSHPNRPHLAKF